MNQSCHLLQICEMISCTGASQKDVLGPNSCGSDLKCTSGALVAQPGSQVEKKSGMKTSYKANWGNQYGLAQ